MSKVAAVIQTYKRPECFEKQIQEVRAQSHPINEVIVSHVKNNRTEEFNFDLADRVVTWGGFKNPYSRYMASKSAEYDTDFLFFLDDDVIPGRRFVELALAYDNEYGGIWGGRGEYYDTERDRLYSGYWPKRWYSKKPAVVDWFGGHCTLMHSYHRNSILYEQRKFDFFSGMDDIWLKYCFHMNASAREFYVTPYPEDNPEFWGVRDLCLADSAFAIHNQDGHTEERTALIKWMVEETAVSFSGEEDNGRSPKFKGKPYYEVIEN